MIVTSTAKVCQTGLEVRHKTGTDLEGKMYRFRATLLFITLALFLTACPGGEGVTGSAPQITSFTANPETITAAGQAVALSWTVKTV